MNSNTLQTTSKTSIKLSKSRSKSKKTTKKPKSIIVSQKETSSTLNISKEDKFEGQDIKIFSFES